MNYSEEEKEAIGHLTKKMEYHKDKPLDTYVWLTLDEHYVRVILNLIQKQDKIIDKMAEYMKEKDIDEDICTKNVINPQLCNEEYSNCKECIKEYFKKVVDEDVKDYR